MFSRFFIDRPIFATVLSVAITLTGGIALFALPVAQYPRITPPGVMISITYPGASAQILADTVAAPIEQEVNGVPGMLYMSSQSGNDGTYALTVTFDIGTDLKTAVVMVQNRVALAMPQLPIEARNQGITIRKKTPDILMIVNFTSPDKRYDDVYLSNYATIYVRDELLRVDGVADVNYLGQRDYSIRAWLDPQKLAARNLTALDVARAIRDQNLDAPAGQVGAPPSPAGQFTQLPIDTLARLHDPEQFGDIILKVGQSRPTRASASGMVGRSRSRLAQSPLTPPSPFSPTLTSPISSDPTVNDISAGTLSGNTFAGTVGTTIGLDPTAGNYTPNTATGSVSPEGGAGAAGGGTTSGGSTATGGATSSSGLLAGGPSGSSSSAALTGLSIASGTTDTLLGSGVLGGATMGRGPGRPSAAIVRLRDVARIELGALSYTQACTFDGQPSVGLSVYQLPGTNALEVADRVVKKMEELKTRFPDGVDYKIGYDTTPYIRESIQDVVVTLLEAVAIVGAVVLVFLQDWRAMVLPMIDVPVSIIGTFAVMALVGFSLNNISLFGLVLAIGIVVDDAIVVLENIERLIATGLDVRTATLKAMDEVTGPIVAVALVLCAVFVPCAFIGGITGQFFRQFALTISVSTVISAINAVTMTPSRAVLLFKTEPGASDDKETRRQGDKETRRQGELPFAREALPWWSFAIVGGLLTTWLARKFLAGTSWGSCPLVSLSPCLLVSFLPGALAGGLFGWVVIRPINAVLGWLFRAFHRGFDCMVLGYGWTVGKTLRLSVLVLGAYAGLVVLTWWVFHKAPTGFIPQQDQGRLIVNIQLPDSASLQRTKEAVEKIADVAMRTKGVKHAVGFAGMSFLLQTTSPNFASMFIVLDPFAERQAPGLRDTDIMARLRKGWRDEVEDAVVNVYPSSPIPGLGTAGGFKFIVEDRGDLGLEQLQKQTDALVRKLREVDGLNNVATAFRANTPQLFLDVDRFKCASLGVSLNDVNQTLDIYLGSLYVTSFNDFGRHWQVTVQAEDRFRNQPEKVSLFQVRNRSGEMVPLGTLVNLREVGGPISVTRYNLYRGTAVNGNIKTGFSTGDAIRAIEAIADSSLPLSMKADWTELMFLQKVAGNSATYIFLLSIVSVFLALSALYESWSLPLAVILVVPLCLLCSVSGVLWTNRDVNVFVQIGLVVLVGLACKNAILIVEYARQLRQEGRTVLEATREASQLRLRPILMTSFAFILGVVPLMLASGAGQEMRRGLGIAVFHGMLGVTLFGIFLTPVFFYVIRGFGEARPALSPATRWILSSALGGGLGLVSGLLLWGAAVIGLPRALALGPPAGILAVLAVMGLHKTIRTVTQEIRIKKVRSKVDSRQ
jgi:multidrug efflux pump